MTGTQLLDELAQAVRSLFQLYQLNYVRLDPRKGSLELSNSLTAFAAKAFMISCNDRNALTRTRNKINCRYVASDGLTGRYVASGRKPRRVLLVFVVKSQRKLRLRRNKKHGDEDSQENPKEDLSEALPVAT
ncbi:hypothetical protein YC2023_108819 [Brassica napus]